MNRQGWICARCSASLSPDVPACVCSASAAPTYDRITWGTTAINSANTLASLQHPVTSAANSSSAAAGYLGARKVWESS